MPTYALIRSRKRRTLCLQIDPSGALRVLVPAATSQRDIDAFLQAKARWIERTLQRLEKVSQAPPFATGLSLGYLDDRLYLELKYEPGLPRVHRHGDTLSVTAHDAGTAKEAIEAWYRDQARHHSVARIIHFAPIVGRAPKRIRIAGQKTRWGSCSTRGTISLNWRLMLASARLFDYVVAHELCHLLAPHHGPSFWREMARVMPDYEDRRVGLRDIGSQLAL